MKKRKTKKLIKSLTGSDRAELFRIVSRGLPYSLATKYQGNLDLYLELSHPDPVWKAGEYLVDPIWGGCWRLAEDFDSRTDSWIKYSDQWDLPSGRLHCLSHSPGSCTSPDYCRKPSPLELEKLDLTPDFPLPVTFEDALRIERLVLPTGYLSGWHDCSYRYSRSGVLLDTESAKNEDDLVYAPSISELRRALERMGIYLSVLYFTAISGAYVVKYKITQYSWSAEYEIEFPGHEMPERIALVAAIPQMLDLLEK